MSKSGAFKVYFLVTVLTLALSSPACSQAKHPERIIERSKGQLFRSGWIVVPARQANQATVIDELRRFVQEQCSPSTSLAGATIGRDLQAITAFHSTYQSPVTVNEEIRKINVNGKSFPAVSRDVMGTVLCRGELAKAWINDGRTVQSFQLRGLAADQLEVGGEIYTISSFAMDGDLGGPFPWPHIYLNGRPDRERIVELAKRLAPESAEPLVSLTIRLDEWFGFQGGPILNYFRAPGAIYTDREHNATVVTYMRRYDRVWIHTSTNADLLADKRRALE